MRIFQSLVIVFFLFGACSGDSTNGDVDSGLARDGSAGRDSSARPLDAPLDAPRLDADRTMSDAELLLDAEQPMDATALDANFTDAGTSDEDAARPRTDAGTPRDPVLGPVQCRVSDDCDGPIPSCQRTAPGGVCSGCAEGTCPSGTECSDFGSCIRSCEIDADCNLGMECLDSGLCGIRACSASEPCPSPYVCSASNRCARPSCDGDSPCPAPLECVSRVCVEP